MKSISSNLLAVMTGTNVYQFSELYTFYLDAGTQRWTTAPFDITSGSTTWVSTGPAITRGVLSTADALEVATLDLTLAPGSGTLGTTPWALAAIQGAFRNARCLVQRAYGLSGQTVTDLLTVFDGPIVEVRPGSTEIGLTVKSGLNRLNEQYPRRCFSTQCPFMFGDAYCDPQGTIKAANTFAKTVNAGPTLTTISVSGTWTVSSPIAGGYIKFTSGVNSGSFRSIQGFTSFATYAVLTMSNPLLTVPGVGDSLTMTYGCTKSRAACSGFSNMSQFGGMPDAPKPDAVAKKDYRSGKPMDVINPFVGTGGFY